MERAGNLWAEPGQNAPPSVSLVAQGLRFFAAAILLGTTIMIAKMQETHPRTRPGATARVDKHHADWDGGRPYYRNSDFQNHPQFPGAWYNASCDDNEQHSVYHLSAVHPPLVDVFTTSYLAQNKSHQIFSVSLDNLGEFAGATLASVTPDAPTPANSIMRSARRPSQSFPGDIRNTSRIVAVLDASEIAGALPGCHVGGSCFAALQRLSDGQCKEGILDSPYVASEESNGSSDLSSTCVRWWLDAAEGNLNANATRSGAPHIRLSAEMLRNMMADSYFSREGCFRIVVGPTMDALRRQSKEIQVTSPPRAAVGVSPGVPSYYYPFCGDLVPSTFALDTLRGGFLVVHRSDYWAWKDPGGGATSPVPVTCVLELPCCSSQPGPDGQLYLNAAPLTATLPCMPLPAPNLHMYRVVARRPVAQQSESKDYSVFTLLGGNMLEVAASSRVEHDRQPKVPKPFLSVPSHNGQFLSVFQFSGGVPGGVSTPRLVVTTIGRQREASAAAQEPSTHGSQPFKHLHSVQIEFFRHGWILQGDFSNLPAAAEQKALRDEASLSIVSSNVLQPYVWTIYLATGSVVQKRLLPTPVDRFGTRPLLIVEPVSFDDAVATNDAAT